MAEITLIFPHQLFAKHPSLKKGRPVFLLEDDLFFNHYRFHLQKLWLHRASLQQYQQFLEKKGFEVTLITHEPNTHMLETHFRRFSTQRIDRIHLAEPTDYLLRRRLDRYCKQFKLTLEYSASPNFINTMEEHHHYFSTRKRYFLTEFFPGSEEVEGFFIEHHLSADAAVHVHFVVFPASGLHLDVHRFEGHGDGSRSPEHLAEQFEQEGRK